MPRDERVRLDDASAILDALLAHLLVAIALTIALVAALTPHLRQAIVGAPIVAAVAIVRLALHPLRLSRLHRVYLERDRDGARVLLAPAFGRARPVSVVAIEHEGHAPWPCALLLEDGTRAAFVARRDDGIPAFFLLKLSDRARYEGRRDSRDSLLELEIHAPRRSRG
jgi:hypothetical protein